MMDNESVILSSNAGAMTMGPCSPPSSAAAALNDCPTDQGPRQRRRRPRRRGGMRSTVAFAAASILTGSLTAATGSLSIEESSSIVDLTSHQPNHHRRLDRSGTKNRSVATPDPRSSTSCNPQTQHTLLFTLYTDAHSIHDNHWQFGHAPFGVGLETGNSGTYIASESVGMGNLGYSAVITHTVCADKASPSGNEATIVESCYDLEISDENGDGLTAPHSGIPGLSGGFTLQIDYGGVVVEHLGQACLSQDENEWNECALEYGFGYCGVRVCTVIDEMAEVGTATVSNLSGSHCTLDQPLCDASSPMKTSSSSIKVLVDTDSYGGEISYEVRKSSRTASKDMNAATQGELILAGGNPVYSPEDSNTVVLGQLGVGIALADNESYESSLCLPDNASSSETCYDFRAYDAYGDGMGCGADGTLAIVIETPDEKYKLEQLDKDQAQHHTVEGVHQLACMNKEKLSKWSYCAVRVCADGTVEGLQGNQCDFGMGDDLIDMEYVDVKIDPLLEPPLPGSGSDGVVNVIEPQSGGPEKEEVYMIEFEDFTLDIVPDKPKPSGNNNNQEVTEMIDDDPTWAEYYANLQPGFREDGAFQQPQPNSAAVASSGSPKPVYQDNRPNRPGQKGPRPNAAKLNDGQDDGITSSKPRPNKEGAGQKGPRPNASKLDNVQGVDDMRPLDAKLNQEGTKGPRPNAAKLDNGDQVVPLKPFSTDLLEVGFPKPIKFPRPNQLSAAVATYLLETFADNDDVATPTDFDLDCDKSKERVGPETRWVMECDGTAFYSGSSDPPRSKVLNSIVRDAFEGESKEDFLELLYGLEAPSSSSSSSPGDNSSNSSQNNRKKKKQMKRKKMLQRLKAKQQQMKEMQQQSGTTVNININQVMNNDKKQTKLDKKQAKLDWIEPKQDQGGELNVMGYVSGSQNMNQLSDTEKGYSIIDGNIHVWIDTNQEKKRESSGDDTKDGKKRMLRSSLVSR